MSKGFIIAGTSSGSGKTTLTLAFLAALAARGYRLAPFKVGPDFIDPGHHTRVTGATSRNLDGWMLTRDYNQKCFNRCRQKADVAVVEGVMGLYDGYDGRSEAGSTAQMAKWLNLPVLLVVDARSMARSAAALVQGFERFDAGVRFAGVIFNRIGSARHLTYLQEALAGHVDMPCLGGIPRDSSIEIPERHLGLQTADDHPLDRDIIARLAQLIETHVAMDRLLAVLEETPFSDRPSIGSGGKTVERVRIGVARDAAFCFYYPDNLELLEGFGAEIVFFSPQTHRTLPEDLDGLYFGGGYPELHAASLAANSQLRTAVRDGSRMNMPIYAECGGFMYLCDRLTDLDGKTYPMAGCFPFGTRMLTRRKALGYREIQLAELSPLGPAGLVGRGHEFHYSELSETNKSVSSIYAVTPRSGADQSTEGYRIRQTLGSYIHLHFGSNPDMARHFVNSCRLFREERIRQR
jgi:cobyrinic acid a,c-diamide synthase